MDRLPAGTPVAYRPNPGAQAKFLSCPHFEALLHGNRARGATFALLMDFAQDVGIGLGPAWRGIIFRETYPQLEDIVAKSRELFSKVFPEASYDKQKHTWHFPGGETLLLRYMRQEKDYRNYHGHEYPFIGWDELTSWKHGRWYEHMLGCARSAHPDARVRVRATTNPWGPGFQWVKDLFQLNHEKKIIITINEADGTNRAAILGERSENKALMSADGGAYDRRMLNIKDPSLRSAWGKRWGWDSPSGNFFEGSWSCADEEKLERRFPCVIPAFKTPDEWAIYRHMDWNTAKPFAVQWTAIADGKTAATLPGGHQWCPAAGSKILIAEWYGMLEGRPNEGLRLGSYEVARGILRREWEWGVWPRVRAGPADGIWAGTDPDPNEEYIAKKMLRVPAPHPNDSRVGVHWTQPNKYPGSRVAGWQLMREAMEATHDPDPDIPGFWVMDVCQHFIRCVSTAPRSGKDPEDVDTESEDHNLDAQRYMFLELKTAGSSSIADIELPESARSFASRVRDFSKRM